ncbi:MAG: methyltransferase domain-containing protein [Desulfobacteraceae bacterium]|nr:MAG: methyltransferase domain-containing protein [Desulfobacteraceae bacterium]
MRRFTGSLKNLDRSARKDEIMHIVEKMKQDWDRRAFRNARFWVDTDHYQDEEVFDQAGNKDVRVFLSLLDDFQQPDWHILEIGCGIGRMLKPMSQVFAQVTGVDVSAQMISQGRERLQGLANIALLENSGADLRIFGADCFDLVYSCIAFQHMPEEIFDRYLDEIHRVLRTSGYLEFQICVGPRREVAFEDTLTVRVYEKSELFEKLERNGFSLKNSYTESIPSANPQSWIFLAQKNTGVKRPAEVPSWERECRSMPSALEEQLTLQLAKNEIRSGKTMEAEKWLRRLIADNPAHLEAWFELAILQINQGLGPQGIETLENMLEKNPVFYSGYYSLVELYQKTGQSEKTANLLSRLRGQQTELNQTLDAVEKLLSSAKNKA